MDDINAVLNKDGVRGALRWLNDKVPHRYSAIYERVGTQLRNLYIFDKLNPEVGLFPDEPISDTYCVLVFDAQSIVQITNAATDTQALKHPKKSLLKAYCGVPLRLSNGEIFGSLCHFDPDSQNLSSDDLRILDEAAREIALRLAILR